MALSSYAQNLLQSYNYLPILAPEDIPTVQNYSGLSTILPTLVTWVQSASAILEQAAQTSSFPTSLSYGAISSLATQGATIAGQIDAMSPAPALLSAEVWDTVVALQTLLIYPELLTS